ncbi:MAG TPA: radical SAM/SPASM domain-containing protein [Syntrophales bacterium]|nr:radical SAM/SPASM domain-containing protein [Syntrophales bacterium]
MMDSRPYIQFYLTLRCNKSCHFCFNKGVSAAQDITIADFKNIAFVLREAGVQCIDILGGEPTLHPALIPLLDIVQMHGMKCNLSSNGTNTDILNSLSERYDEEFLRIGISLNSHAPSSELHEYIIRHRPVLKTVLTKKTTIPDGCEQYIGMPGIEYFLLYMDVVDNHDFENSMSFYSYYEKLTRMKRAYTGLEGVFCSGFVSPKQDYSMTKSARCPAGTAKLSILPDGSVYPCYLFYRYREFEIGNILRDDFQKIWQNPILNYFRTFSGNNCPQTGCALFSSCRGGCPAVSYIFYKDLDVPDPRCNYEARPLFRL